VAVLAAIVPLLVAAWHLRSPIEAFAFLARSGDWVSRPSTISWGRALVWLVVAAGVLMGWRLLAAAGVAVIAEVVVAWKVPPPGLPAPIPTESRALCGSDPVLQPNAYTPPLSCACSAIGVVAEE
jgi:hypothetical protein